MKSQERRSWQKLNLYHNRQCVEAMKLQTATSLCLVASHPSSLLWNWKNQKQQESEEGRQDRRLVKEEMIRHHYSLPPSHLPYCCFAEASTQLSWRWRRCELVERLKFWYWVRLDFLLSGKKKDWNSQEIWEQDNIQGQEENIWKRVWLSWENKKLFPYCILSRQCLVNKIRQIDR